MERFWLYAGNMLIYQKELFIFRRTSLLIEKKPKEWKVSKSTKKYTFCVTLEKQPQRDTSIISIIPNISPIKNGGRRWESNPPSRILQHASSVLKTETSTSHATPATVPLSCCDGGDQFEMRIDYDLSANSPSPQKPPHIRLRSNQIWIILRLWNPSYPQSLP